jgi:hypothetical protein
MLTTVPRAVSLYKYNSIVIIDIISARPEEEVCAHTKRLACLYTFISPETVSICVNCREIEHSLVCRLLLAVFQGKRNYAECVSALDSLLARATI